jgi:hypothetical protein
VKGDDVDKGCMLQEANAADIDSGVGGGKSEGEDRDWRIRGRDRSKRGLPDWEGLSARVRC